MKFIIILYTCSAIASQCLQTSIVPKEFVSYSECANWAYRYAYKSFLDLDKETVDLEKIAIRFECRELKVE